MKKVELSNLANGYPATEKLLEVINGNTESLCEFIKGLSRGQNCIIHGLELTDNGKKLSAGAAFIDGELLEYSGGTFPQGTQASSLFVGRKTETFSDYFYYSTNQPIKQPVATYSTLSVYTAQDVHHPTKFDTLPRCLPTIDDTTAYSLTLVPALQSTTIGGVAPIGTSGSITLKDGLLRIAIRLAVPTTRYADFYNNGGVAGWKQIGTIAPVNSSAQDPIASKVYFFKAYTEVRTKTYVCQPNPSPSYTALEFCIKANVLYLRCTATGKANEQFTSTGDVIRLDAVMRGTSC